MDQLIVRGAREHNLKDVSLDLPRDALIVFTGLSGSGKSSLAFDTIFAEGQRRYVESLSAYARQFLGQMDKPDVDFIEGLSPGGLDRPEVDLPQPALDGRHDHRGLRLPAAALRPGRPAALPGLRRADQPADARSRSSTGCSRWTRAPGSRCSRRWSAAARASTSTSSASCRPRATPGPGRRRDRVAGRAAQAEEAGEAHHRGGRRPARGQGVRQAAAHRLGRDRARPGRRPGHPRLRRPAGGRPAPRAAVLRAPRLPQRPPAVDRGAGAAVVLLQLALRRLPRVHRPRHPDGGRPGADRARRREVARRGRDRAVGGRARPRASTSCGCWRRWPTTSAFGMDTPWRKLPARAQDAVLHGLDDQVHVRYRNRYGRSAPTTPASRARSRSCSAGTPRPSRTGAATATRATCARCPARPAAAPGSSRSRSRCSSAAGSSPTSAGCRSASATSSCATSS